VPFAEAIQRLDSTGRPVASDRTVIDQETVRLVDAGVAERRAQELLGRNPAFGGTYELGTAPSATGRDWIVACPGMGR